MTVARRLHHLVALESGARIDHHGTVEQSAISIGGEHIQNGSFSLGTEPRVLPIEFYESQRKGRIEVGDTLMVKDGATLGKSMYVDSKPFRRMLVNEHVFVIKPKRIDPRFLHFLIQSRLSQHSIWASVMAAAQPGVGRGFTKTIRVSETALLHQKVIADFLDHEISYIDQLIRKKETLVIALQEKLMQEMDVAFTSGLDKSRAMQKTGIPWIPQIPEHWTLVRAKHLFREAQNPPLDDDKIITAFRDGEVTLRENRRTEGFTFAVLEVGYQHINAGDLVIHTMDAFAGAIGVSDSSGKATGEYAVCEARSNNVNNYYYAGLLKSMAKRNYIFVLCPSVRERAPRFRFVRFAPIFLPVPPRSEQDQIVEYVKQCKTQIDNIKKTTSLSIDRLIELRSALITKAVAGEIDVTLWKQRGETDRRLEVIEQNEIAPTEKRRKATA